MMDIYYFTRPNELPLRITERDGVIIAAEVVPFLFY